jgi:hypothetical protein
LCIGTFSIGTTKRFWFFINIGYIILVTNTNLF